MYVLENERKGLSSFPVPSSAVKGLTSASGNAKEKQNLIVKLGQVFRMICQNLKTQDNQVLSLPTRYFVHFLT